MDSESTPRSDQWAGIVRGLQQLLPYVQFLFDQWDKAVGTWSETDCRRQHLKYLADQVLGLFGQQHYAAILKNPQKAPLDPKTQRQLDTVLSTYASYKTILAKTPLELNQILEDTEILSSTGILPEPFDPKADALAQQAWHEKVTKNERLFLYKSGQYTGYFIGHGEESDTANRAQRACYWQQIGTRLLYAGHWEQALRWVMGAFLAERPHQQTYFHWAPWLTLFGQIAEQALAAATGSPCQNREPIDAIEPDYRRYQRQLQQSRTQLQQAFQAIPTPEFPCPALAQALQAWQEHISALLTQMLQDAELLLGTPACAYAIVYTGSLSRDAATAYSDLEIMLLVEDPALSHALKAALEHQPVTTHAQASHAQHLLYLLRLFRFKLASLGDSALALDASGDPLQEPRLIGTPEEYLHAIQAPENQTGDRGWAYSLAHVQAKRCYAHPAGQTLLARYQRLLQKAFAAPELIVNWHPIPWLLNHQHDNHLNYTKDNTVFNLKTHALKPLTLLLIDIAGLAGLDMHSVPAALHALRQADYLPATITADLVSLWQGVLQWRCYQQVCHQGPIDTITDPFTPSQQQLKDYVTCYLTAFYDLLPWLTTYLTSDDLDNIQRLHQVLTIWAATVALHQQPLPAIAQAFQAAAQQTDAPLMAGVQVLLGDPKLQQPFLQAMADAATQPDESPIIALLYVPLCSIWIANTRLNTLLTRAIMAYPNSSQHIASISTGQESATAARLWRREYPALVTYDDPIRMAVCRELETLQASDPNATPWGLTVWLRQALDDDKPQTVRTLLTLDAAQGWDQPNDLFRLYQYLEQQRQNVLVGPWADIKAQLQASHIGFHWLVCQREALSSPLQPGALPLRTYDSLDDTQDIHYTLPPTWVTQVFDDAGQPIKANRDGKRIVGEMKDDQYHLHVKFFPELPGVEAAVQALSLQFGLGGVAPTQLCRCPYRPTVQERTGAALNTLVTDQHLGQPILLSPHIPGTNVQKGFRDDPVRMEAQLAQLHQGHFTRLLLLMLLIHPEDGQPANFILTDTAPDSQGRPYRLISVDNDHAFVLPWVKDHQGLPQMQIKTLVFCLPAMQYPLDAAVLRTFQQAGEPMALIRDWLQALNQRSDAYFRLLTESERQALHTPSKKPYCLNTSDPISPLLQLTLHDVSGVYERLERLRALLDTPQPNELWTGLTLLAHVSPQVAPSYHIVQQRYQTVQDRFAHVSDQQYKLVIRKDPITQIEQRSYQTFQTSDKLLAQRGIPLKALVKGAKFRPRDILPRLAELSTQHRDTIRGQLFSSNPNHQVQGQSAYDQLLLDTQRAQVLSGVDAFPITEEGRIWGYWRDLTLMDMTLHGFTRMTDKSFQALLLNKPLLQSLFLSGSPQLTPGTLQSLAHYAPRLRQLWLHDCLGITEWPCWPRLTGLRALVNTPKPLVWAHLQTLQLTHLPLRQLTLTTPELVHLDITQCPDLLSIGFSIPPSTPLHTLTLAQLPQLSPTSLTHLVTHVAPNARLTLTNLLNLNDTLRIRHILAALWQTGHPCWETTLPWLAALIDTTPPGHPNPEPGTLDLRGLPLPPNSISHLATITGKPITHWVLPYPLSPDLTPLWQRSDTTTLSGYPAQEPLMPKDGHPENLESQDEPPPEHTLSSPRIPNLPTFDCYQTLTGYTSSVEALATYPDGAFLSGLFDNTIHYWRPTPKGFVLHQTLTGHTGAVMALAICPDGTFLSSSLDNTIRYWLLTSNGFVCHQILKGHTHRVHALTTCPDGAFLSASKDRTIRYWRPAPQGFALHQILRGHTGSVYALATCPDGAFLSASEDNTIRYWRPNPNGFVLHQTLTGHTKIISTLTTCPDGAFLSGSYDNTIRYWRPDPNGFMLHQTLTGHTNAVLALATYPDGTFLSGSWDNTIRYWRPDPNGFVLHQTLTDHTNMVTALTTCLDGTFLSASNDITIRYWTNPLCRVALPYSADLATAFTQALPVGSLWLITHPIPHGITVTFNDILLPDTIKYLKCTLDNLAFALSGITSFTLAFHKLDWQLTFTPPNSTCQQLILSLIDILHARCLATIPVSDISSSRPSPIARPNYDPRLFHTARQPQVQLHVTPELNTSTVSSLLLP